MRLKYGQYLHIVRRRLQLTGHFGMSRQIFCSPPWLCAFENLHAIHKALMARCVVERSQGVFLVLPVVQLCTWRGEGCLLGIIRHGLKLATKFTFHLTIEIPVYMQSNYLGAWLNRLTEIPLLLPLFSADLNNLHLRN